MAKIEKKPSPQAIVLAGGGAYGAYGIGVMKALFNGRWQRGLHGPISPEIFTGTSVGAFNAALMVAEGRSQCLCAVQRLQTLWLEQIARKPGQTHNVFRIRGNPFEYARYRSLLPYDLRILTSNWIRRGLSIGLSPEPNTTRLLRLFDLDDLISSQPLKDLIDTTIEPQRIFHPGAQTLAIITTEWNSGQVMVFSNRSNPGPSPNIEASFDRERLTPENLRAIIRGSTAVPGFLSPVHLGSKVFVDGGVLMNAPLQPALDAGARTLHVIHLRPDPLPIPRGRSRSAWETLERIMVTVPAAFLARSLEGLSRQQKAIRAAWSLERYLSAKSDHSIAPRDRQAMESFIESFRSKPPLTIHRYSPTRMATDLRGMWNFGQDWLIELIEEGFTDAIEHDCEANGCLI